MHLHKGYMRVLAESDDDGLNACVETRDRDQHFLRLQHPCCKLRHGLSRILKPLSFNISILASIRRTRKSRVVQRRILLCILLILMSDRYLQAWCFLCKDRPCSTAPTPGNVYIRDSAAMLYPQRTFLLIALVHEILLNSRYYLSVHHSRRHG